MHLRYAFRLYPDVGQRTALARAFGCARVVFNDAVRAPGMPAGPGSRSRRPEAVEEAGHRGETDSGTVLAG
nr:helix-turn-helix domain-containing protein [Streptomyces phaeolivaceus]